MSNVELLFNAYREWNDTKGKSSQKWLELMAEDVVFHSLAGGRPGMEFTKECHSKEDVAEYFAGLARDWEMIHYTPEEFIEQGDRVVMRGSCCFISRHTAKKLETPKVDIFHFRDGRIREFYEYYDTARAFEAVSHDV